MFNNNSFIAADALPASLEMLSLKPAAGTKVSNCLCMGVLTDGSVSQEKSQTSTPIRRFSQTHLLEWVTPLTPICLERSEKRQARMFHGEFFESR